MDNAHRAYNFFEDLLVVLVIFKMEINESPAFNSLTRALQSSNERSSIFIYDNSPHPHTFAASKHWEITYRNDPSNPGVSKAYNEGFQVAKTQNKKWLLFVDQDSAFNGDFFLKCKISAGENANENVFVPVMMDSKGIVSPFHFRFGRGLRLDAAPAGLHQLSKMKFINSGLLIACDLFEISGGYDERFQLDFSDLVFLEKLKLVRQSFFVIDTICTHALAASDRTTLRKPLGRFKVYAHAACLFGQQTGNSWVIFWKYMRGIAFFFRFFDWRFMTLAFSKC